MGFPSYSRIAWPAQCKVELAECSPRPLLHAIADDVEATFTIATRIGALPSERARLLWTRVPCTSAANG